MKGAAASGVVRKDKVIFVQPTAPESPWINLLAVIDTEWVKSTCMRPSQDPSHPTQVDARGVFMFCSGGLDVGRDPVTELSCITVGVGCRMVLRAVSVSNNADDAVIVYAVRTRNCADHLTPTPFVPVVVTLDAAVQPNPDEPDGGIPPLAVATNFSSLNSSAVVMAPRLLTADFGLYTLSPDGQSQRLHGYFRWVFRLQRETPADLPAVNAVG